MTESSAGKSIWKSVLIAVLLIAGLITAVLHFGDLKKFADLARSAKPGWLAAAVVLQLITYMCVAFGWSMVLRAGHSPLPVRRLFPLAISKLFAD